MTEDRIESLQPEGTVEPVDSGKGRYAAGGLFGAILASSCCVGPLLLLTLGVSGAWIGSLTALEPYKPYFAAVAIVFVALGFRQTYVKSLPTCDTGSFCARPASSRITKTSLWFATLLVASALTIDWWAPLFY